MSVELYFFQPLGTNSGRVYLALLEKGVGFTRRELNGREFDHLQLEYLAINPKGQVPTLVRDGRPFPEGMIATNISMKPSKVRRCARKARSSAGGCAPCAAGPRTTSAAR